MTPIAARCRLLLTGAATLAATALLAAPATASVAPAAAGCPETPVVQPFAQFDGDDSDYFLAPDGGFENGAAGWTLHGQTAVTQDNEPWAVNAAGDAAALRLAPGSSATTEPFCIGVEHRSMRFFSNAASSSTMNVDVLIEGPGASQPAVRVAAVRGSDAWAPSDIVPMIVNELAAEQGNAMNVRLRFTPHGAGAWTIDDVFVDPYRMR
ncbi:MAG: hypothetical protein H0W96_16650 [Solirubrobacterales bacterium]|nr:hypothetical protein [Solirubrobacterales bacterium]